MKSSFKTALIAAGSFAVLALPMAAAAHGTPDQINLPETGNSADCGSPGGATLSQSFTPSFRQLVAVALQFRAGGSFPSTGATLSIRLESEDGRMIGQASALATPPSEMFSNILVHFDFASPLVLEPQGQFRIVWITTTGAVVSWLLRTDNPYPDGTSGTCGGSPISEWDFNFVTYVPADTSPPDTSITSGPEAGSVLASPTSNLTFTGTDDLSYASGLRFMCSVDGQPTASCTSQTRVGPLHDGLHTFAVAAVDQAGSADVSPAETRWTVDTTPPNRPQIRGPRRTRARRAVFSFVSSDAVTASELIRYKCALDKKRLSECGPRKVFQLKPGRHIVHAVALDGVGNQSPVAKAVVTRRRARKG
jgi:hypothetical protein